MTTCFSVIAAVVQAIVAISTQSNQVAFYVIALLAPIGEMVHLQIPHPAAALASVPIAFQNQAMEQLIVARVEGEPMPCWLRLRHAAVSGANVSSFFLEAGGNI